MIDSKVGGVVFILSCLALGHASLDQSQQADDIRLSIDVVPIGMCFDSVAKSLGALSQDNCVGSTTISVPRFDLLFVGPSCELP
jgi:hypothetical protein